MRKRLLLLAGLLMCLSLSYAQMMPSLPADTAVRVGRLDNGLTYYIRYNNWPEHRANFYIAQRVGSLQEEDSQRGLAHFLEHMCFNGTRNFPGNGVIRFCESIGVQFGSDLNAYTSIEETVYRIDNVPTANKASLDSCLLVLHDWAADLTLDGEEIDKERGVIHEEWRLRTSANSRMLERNLPRLYPGSKYGERYPIGTMEVIDNFKHQELVDYYHRWYHPSNQGIIVVGDVDVDATEARIRELFAGIEEPADAPAIVPVEVPDNDEPIIIVDKDKEYQTSNVNVFFKHEAFPAALKGTAALLAQSYVNSAVAAMLGARYTEAAQKGDCPYVRAYAYDGEYLFARTKDAFTIGILPKDPTKTEEAMKAAIVEARRAFSLGFTDTEYARFKDDFVSQLDKQLSNKDKRTNSELYEPLKAHFIEGEAMPDIETEVQLYKQFAQMLPLENINAAVRSLVQSDGKNVVILNFNNEKDGATYPTEESLKAALAEALSAELVAFVDNVKDEPLIAKTPKPGKIKREERNDKFGYTELTLSNGVKVVLKHTDFKKDEVTLSGLGKGGSTLYGLEDNVNLQLFDNVISLSGLGNFSSTELQKALAGKIANADLQLEERYTTLSGSSTPKDVETMLQMTYLYFTDIRKDEDAFGNLVSQLEVALQNRELNPDLAFRDSVTATIYGHNPRLAPLTLQSLPHLSYDRILDIAKERTASAEGWEFTFIGNFDEATLRPLICQWLGALPTKKKNVESQRMTKPVTGIVENVFKRKQETPKATAVILWSNRDLAYTYERAVQMDMVGQILDMEYLQKIREDASAAYSVGASAGASRGRDGWHIYTLQAYCPMKPEKADVAITIMQDEVEAAAERIDDEKLTKVKELMRKRYDDNQNKNAYWAQVIDTWRYYGEDIQADGRQVIDRQTTATLKAFMKEFLQQAGRIQVVMLPEEE